MIVDQSVLLMIGGLGLPEMLLIGGAILLLFGANRLPQLARSLGQSLTEFKKGVKADPEKEQLGSGDDPDRLPEKAKAESREG